MSRPPDQPASSEQDLPDEATSHSDKTGRQRQPTSLSSLLGRRRTPGQSSGQCRPQPATPLQSPSSPMTDVAAHGPAVAERPDGAGSGQGSRPVYPAATDPRDRPGAGATPPGGGRPSLAMRAMAAHPGSSPTPPTPAEPPRQATPPAATPRRSPVTWAQATAAPPMAPAAPPAPAPPRAVAGGPQSVSLSGYGEPARPEPGKGKGSQAEKKRTTTPSSGLTKREFPEDPQAFIKQNLDRYVCMSQVQIEAIEQLPLPEKEQRLVEPASKGNLRLREILSMSSLLRTKTIQFLVALYANGFVDLSDSPSATANEADLLGEIKEHLSRIERSNHFAALEIHMSSTGKEVEAAYKGLMEKYSEAKLAGHSAEVREAASKLRGGLQKAYKAICAHADRQAYRRDQVGDWKVGWYAEFQFNKGDSMLTLREDIEQALGYFESAYDLAPENGLYLAAVAYTRFRAAGAGSDKAARQEARSLMDKARKLSPKEPQVLIIAARLEFDCRMVVEARNLLRAAEKLCPDPQKYSQLVRAYRVGDLE